MTALTELPAPGILKTYAKRMRTNLAKSGISISHSRSLELLAAQHGYRDWNTLNAAVDDASTLSRFAVGQRVRGLYLGRSFRGCIVGMHSFGNTPDRCRVTVRFDESVDVSRFKSMKIERRQVKGTIDQDGRTAEKTSDGQPHMIVQVDDGI